MRIIKYISISAIPTAILIIILQGLIEKKKVFDIFAKGAKEGFEMAIKLFPTLVGLFLAIGALNSSGILEFVVQKITPILQKLKIPSEIIPLALLRPISGSGSIAIGSDLMKKYGVDSKIGLIVSTIMGSTETTLYIIAIYTSSIKVKKIKYVLFVALMADLTGILVSVIICNLIF